MMEWLSERFNPGPLFGWLSIIFLALIPILWLRVRLLHRRPAVRFSLTSALRSFSPTLALRTRFVIPLLRTLAILCLIVALARPQSGGEYHDSSEGIAIQMVLDVSGSMAADDFVMEGRRVRRLDAVKRVFEDFVLGRGDLGGREGDLIGMTVFAMFAETRCPLTLDHGSLVDLLRETEIPGFVNGRQVREEEEAGYTALGDAVALATDDLRRAGEQSVAGIPGAEAAKSRIMILLTDGKDNPAPIAGTTPPDPLEAAKVAATLGIKVYTIGAIGGAPPSRQDALSFFFQQRAEVDEPMLKNIAQLTGGKYFRATDLDSLVTIYDEIGKLEQRKTGERSFQDNIYAATLAMEAGLGLLLIELLLSCTRYRRIP